MKKIITSLFIAASAGFFAQSISVYKINNSGAITNTITNGGGYTLATTAGSDSHPSAAVYDIILIKNNTSATHTYNVVRTVISQNPALQLDGSQNRPQSYFCFGYTCFGSDVNTPPSSNDYTILGPVGSTTATPPADNSQANGQLFAIYIAEGNVQGNYLVQYKLFNVSDPNDTLSFRVGYNRPLVVGIKNLERSADLISDIYPNPAGNTSKIFFDLGKDDELKFQVYNSLGSLVASSDKQKYAAGRNQLPVDASELNTGVYFITISNATSTLTKRLIITK